MMMRFAPILGLLAFLLAGPALAQRTVGIGDLEVRPEGFPLPAAAKAEAADRLAAAFARRKDIKVVDRGAMRQVQKAISEIVLNPVYDDKAKLDLGAIVPAQTLVVAFISEVSFEGQVTETSSVVDLEDGVVHVDLAVRLVDVASGTVLGSQRAAGSQAAKGIVYSKKTGKTRDSEGMTMETALRRAIAAAIARVDVQAFEFPAPASGTVAGGSAPADGKSTEITVSADDVTCAGARQAGLRKAIEQVAGAVLQGRTEVKDMQFESGRIVQVAEGAIKRFQELGAETLAGGGCRMRLLVEVYEGRLADSLEAMLKDARAVAIFAKTDFANRSLAVVYATKGVAGALPPSHKGAEALIGGLRKRLIELGFDVKLLGPVDEGDAALGTAKADALIVAGMSAGQQTLDGGALSITASARITAFDVSNRRVFAEVEGRGRRLGPPGSFGETDTVARAAEEAGRDGADKVIMQAVAHFGKKGNTLLLTLRDATDKLQAGVEELLGSNGIDFAVEKQSGGTLVLKVTTGDDATTFRTRLRRLAEGAGLKIAAVGQEGSTLVFSGKVE